MVNSYVGMLKNGVDFAGKANRKEFWLAILANALITGCLSLIGGIGMSRGMDLDIILLAYEIVIFVPLLAIIVRRLHDVGKKGWYLLWNLIPIIGFIMILVQLVKESECE